MKKPLALLGVSAIVGFGALTFGVGPAQATEPPTCPEWNLRSIVNTWGSPAEGSVVTNGHTVTLVKPTGGGTEFSTGDAGLDVTGTTTITVNYDMTDAADFSAGAVRLFYYTDKDADTLTDAPTGSVAADAKSGTLTLSGVSGPIGTLGLVYDASNNAGGAVTFTNLKVGDVPVAFKDVCTPTSPSPEPTSPSPEPTASDSPSPSPSASTNAPTPTPSTSQSPQAGLPVTGDSNGKKIAAIGGAAVVIGAIAAVVARKRRTRFQA